MTDKSKDNVESGYLKSQVRRRCLTSAGISTLGIIFMAFGLVKEPVAFTLLFIFAMIVICFVLLLAMMELIAASHMITRDKQLSNKAKIELLREHDRLKEKLEKTKAEEKN